MTDEVAARVLYDNYTQTQTLSSADAQAVSMLGVHARLIRSLEQIAGLRPRARVPAHRGGDGASAGAAIAD